MSKIFKIFAIISLFIIFFSICFNQPVSFDTGWHLASGKYYLENKTIPKTDIFSHSMSDFTWVNHEWLTDVIIYSLYSEFGLTALSLFYGLIIFLAFFITARSVKTELTFQLITACLAGFSIFYILGPKPQMITLLGLALVLTIFNQFRIKGITLFTFLLIPIFLIWANLHAGFILGLVLLLLMISLDASLKIIGKQKINRKYLAIIIFIGVLSFTVTLINPYGFGLYQEIFRTIRDTMGQTLPKIYITEWQNVSFSGQRAYYFFPYLFLTALLIIIFRKKIDWFYIILPVIILPFSLSSWRNTPFFILLTIPIFLFSFNILSQNNLFKRIFHPLILSVIFLPLLYLGLKSIFGVCFNLEWKTIAALNSFPQGAVEFINNKPELFSGNMLNKYDWGSYLTFFLPEHKVFIDGRMLHWKIDDKEIYKDYIDFAHNLNLQILDKYKIDWLIFPPQSKVCQILFQNKKWQLLYLDSDAIILKKLP